MALLLGACQSPLNVEAALDANEVAAYSPLTATGAISRLMVERYQATIATAGNYIDLPSDGSGSRSLDVDLAFLGDRLPADLSTLMRQVNKPGSRTAETVSLRDELDTIRTAYELGVSRCRPDATLAKTLPYVKIDDENIYLSDDEVVPLDSPQGFFLIELLNACAAGETPQAASDRINADLQRLLSELPLESRGLVRMDYRDNKKWSGAVVPYWCVDVSEEHKGYIRQAMAEWQIKTGNAVRFAEVTQAEWTAYVERFFGIHRILEIKDDAGLSKSGETTQDRNNVKFKANMDKPSYLSAAKHELGHVLGLEHEHQRADRDDYVVSTGFNPYFDFGLTLYNIDYEKIPEFQKIWWYDYTPIWGWFPSWTYREAQQRVSQMTTAFDYHSIMLYSSNITPNPVYAKLPFEGNGGLDPNGYYRIYDSQLRITDFDAGLVVWIYTGVTPPGGLK